MVTGAEEVAATVVEEGFEKTSGHGGARAAQGEGSAEASDSRKGHSCGLRRVGPIGTACLSEGVSDDDDSSTAGRVYPSTAIVPRYVVRMVC